MRKKALVVAMATAIFLSAGLGYAFENEPEGFRDLKWGDPPTDDMTFAFMLDPESKVYIRLNEKLCLGEAKLKEVEYGFYQDRLMMVVLLFEEDKNYDLLKSICKKKFGEETEKKFGEIAWLSLKTGVILRYHFVEDRGRLSLGNRLIVTEHLKAEEKQEIESTEEEW